MIRGLCTVIIPTHGRERMGWLREAIASVVNQASARWELIVVRDAADPLAPDERPELPPRSRYARGHHPGLSASLNRAAELAQGEFLTVVQDDDWILPNKLSTALEYFAQHPAAEIVYSLPLYVDADGMNGQTPEKLRAALRAHPVMTAAHLRAGVPFLVHGTATVYRRRVWERAGEWDETLRTAEEWEYHLRLLSCGAIFHGIEDVTTVYRQHSGQKTGTVKTRHGSYNKRRSAVRKAALSLIHARYPELVGVPLEAVV